MKKLLLALMTTVLCLSLFSACIDGGGSSTSDSSNTGSDSSDVSTDTGSNSEDSSIDTGSSGDSYDGWEVIDPIGNGGDYTFND